MFSLVQTYKIWKKRNTQGENIMSEMKKTLDGVISRSDIAKKD